MVALFTCIGLNDSHSKLKILVIKAIENIFFPCLHNLIQTREGLGEFETVMQTRDEVEGLHNCREFSQLLECLYEGMQTQEKSFLLLL